MSGPRKVEVVLPPGRLWPNAPSGSPVAIEVFGATGEFKSGKTLLGLSIAPGCHPEGHAFAGQPRTLLLDFEKSAGTYGGTGCRRIDVPSVMLEKHGGTYSPLQVFEWFLSLIENQIKSGQFDVVMADPITDIESGLVEFVKKNCAKFGLSSNQVAKGGGLLWGAVKDFWKMLLLKLATRCQTFYFTSHLRDEWSGNTPTGRRQPKGKETLMELASLYLWLKREPDRDGRVPAVPTGVVLKDRLSDTTIDDAGGLTVTPLLPPALPEASVAAIRRYIARPPDYRKLKAGELAPEEVFGDEQRLRLEVARAEAERDAEQTRLARTERAAELQRQRPMAPPLAVEQPGGSGSGNGRSVTPQAAAPQAEPDESAALQAKADTLAAQTQATEAKLLASVPDEHRMAGDKATRSQVDEILSAIRQLGITDEQKAALLNRVGARNVHDLSRAHALQMANFLRRKLAEKQAEKGAEKQPGGNQVPRKN